MIYKLIVVVLKLCFDGFIESRSVETFVRCISPCFCVVARQNTTILYQY